MRRGPLLAAVAAACLVLPSAAAADTIRVQSTTDTVDAGLKDGLIVPAYQAAQPGDTLDYTAVGTGKALDNAKAGMADVVITHAPSLEAQFVQQGYSLGLGHQIFYSDYVIVGPTDDPAGVAARHPHDAIGAFEDIAAGGDANANAVRFESRGENSGTNVQEQIMWGLTSTVTKQAAVNAGGDATRFEPGSGGTYPAWYVKTMAGQAANLNQTEACAAAGNGCYTIVDRGTFNRAVNGGTVTHLKIVSEKNATTARGGENLLVNPFSVYIVNPAKISTSPSPNVAAATRFVQFLTSASFQAAVAGFPSALQPAFLPDAFPSVALDHPLPQSLTAGSTIAIAGTVTNRLPGAGVVKGIPVQLQQTTGSGAAATWTSVGAPAPTFADGRFVVRFKVTTTGSYRLATPEYTAQSLNNLGYNAFSAATQDIGAITAVAVKDTKKPLATKVKLGRRGVSLRVSEASSIRLVIQHRVRRGHKLVYRTVQTLHRTASKARLVSAHHRALSAGRYRVQITLTDLAKNHRSQTRLFTLR